MWADEQIVQNIRKQLHVENQMVTPHWKRGSGMSLIGGAWRSLWAAALFTAHTSIAFLVTALQSVSWRDYTSRGILPRASTHCAVVPSMSILDE